MIKGLGHDMVDIRRVEKLLKHFGEVFEKRIFTEKERAVAAKLSESKRAAFYAKRFAIKEACAKALGVGIGAKLSFQDIEISNLDNGQPVLKVKKHKGEFLVSVSDEYPYASAVVLSVGSGQNSESSI